MSASRAGGGAGLSRRWASYVFKNYRELDSSEGRTPDALVIDCLARKRFRRGDLYPDNRSLPAHRITVCGAMERDAPTDEGSAGAMDRAAGGVPLRGFAAAQRRVGLAYYDLGALLRSRAVALYDDGDYTPP